LQHLEGKKILFISSDFFELRSSIQSEFKQLKLDVTYIANKPSYFGSLFNKIFKNYMNIFYKLYYFFKLFNKKDYDYIFVINGEFIPYTQCERLLKKNKDAKSILYCWDAFSSSTNSKKLYTLFDKRYSFSKVDCKTYRLTYKLLFFIYKTTSNDIKKYDYSVVASYSEDRYKKLQVIKNILEKNNLTYFFHLFITEVGYYRESKRLNEKLDKDICKVKKISNSQTSKIISQSNCVIDLIDPSHEGQSLRVFEAIGNDIKILTTNTSIINEKFYDSKMIRLLNDKFIVDKEWLEYEGHYKNKEQYHISNWVKNFFE